MTTDYVINKKNSVMINPSTNTQIPRKPTELRLNKVKSTLKYLIIKLIILHI